MAKAAGTTLGAISLGITVAQELYKYYASCRDQKSDVVKTTRKLGHLLEWLKKVEGTLGGGRRSRNDDDPKLLADIQSRIDDCRELIEELEEEHDKVCPVRRQGSSIRNTGRLLAYPFRQSTLQKLCENVDDFVSLLEQSLQLMEHRDISKVRDDVEDIAVLFNQVCADQISAQIKGWLKAPDATINFNEAVKNKKKDTGSWLVLSQTFTAWLKNSGSFLWLVGFAGCGKSVLCSTAIAHTSGHCRTRLDVGIAFFYFTFNDETKQDASSMLRALILQLSGQLDSKREAHNHLSRLYNRYLNATPPVADLLVCLHKIALEFRDDYIFVDALDESPVSKHREEVLACLTELRKWSDLSLHLLVSSRDEVDIRQDLETLPEETVRIQNGAHDKDIKHVISESLRNNKRLKNWKDYHARIETALATRCNGVFRWVECQLRSLQGCPRSEDLLERHLQALPKTLEETYERILSNIPPSFKDYAQRVLMLLCCAMRPLTVGELIDGIAVELGKTPRYNPKRKLEDIDSIQQVCPGLTEVDVNHYSDEVTIRIAHFSVREYLESQAIRHSKDAAMFSVKRDQVNAQMVSIALAILLNPPSESPIDISEMQSKLESRDTMVAYAGTYWPDHYVATDDNSQAESQALSLFTNLEGLFERWVFVMDSDFDHHFWDQRFGSKSNCYRISIASPLHHASRYGLTSIVRGLLVSKEMDDDKEAHLGISLEVASAYGHEDTVKLLVDADGNPPQKSYQIALREASKWGYERIVRLLLDKGVDINAGSGRALVEASEQGHDKVAQLLIENKADVNGYDGLARPLWAAAKEGHLKIVRLLVESGADVHADREKALQDASESGHKEVVQFLIDYSTDIHAQHGSALISASAQGHKDILQLLIDHGADFHANCTQVLRSAAGAGHEGVVQLVIDNGADVNRPGPWETALQAAALRGPISMMKLLIKNNADLNEPQESAFRSALQAASMQGHNSTVQFLLDAGVDVNARGGQYGSALQAASSEGHDQTVRLLLQHGADTGSLDASDLLGKRPRMFAARRY